MTASNFTRIGLIGRYRSTQVREAIDGLIQQFSQPTFYLIQGDDTIPGIKALPENVFAENIDLAIAIGGDGTMLYAARLLAANDVPLLGINRGRLGFLADVAFDAMVPTVRKVLEGAFERDERALLAAEIQRSDGHFQAHALNDIVVQKSGSGRMLEVETYIGGRFVNRHRGDGLIISTPTGSTAYALSGGGPIIKPGLDALLLVPICPHSLSDRPIVINADELLEVKLVGELDHDALVTADGRSFAAAAPGESIKISVSSHKICLLHPQGYDYFSILRSKMAWGRGSTESS